ncbi:MAG TPA: response regulator transcription factor [Oscillospiraceae bacterium]|nr:response regulator transcription factor [Oscillospiraceae bacterium]HPF56960.1 response regulator transcription factor [Clostridiales bacterium]HPK34249.1 response regulator transcription factor [Oscillospiraceae bacterium]HPR74848.1 response regulator transcription factor [Oscillospiraceae bacterium]
MIIVVEDDRGIRELVVYTLQNTGFKAMGCENAQELYTVLKTEKPQLILLDIMLPGEDGISILKRLRQNAAMKKVPIIMLTAKGAEYDKVIGLDSGADDYITKPFGMMEMISRIKAVLRRAEETNDDVVYAFHNIVLNVKAHSISVNGSAVEVTLKEFELLRLLMKNAGTVLTRDMLLENIWGYGFDGETRTVDVHIGTLRSKLGDSGELIETVRGVGYRIGNEV